MEVFAILVEPRLPGVVVGIDIDHLGIPIGFLTGNIVAALQNEDAFAGRREVICQRPSTGAGADNNHVIAVVV
jgi:hypothetical protein